VRTGYRVSIVPPGGQHFDPLAQSVSIIVINYDNGTSMLSPDGTWVPLTEGVSTGKPTIALPAEAMDALIEAVDRYRGAPSHAKTEAAVLREWLAKEQSRVDEVFHAVGKPIVFASPVCATCGKSRDHSNHDHPSMGHGFKP
jgi:hypothetical protein